jgi:hypothetical protein
VPCSLSLVSSFSGTFCSGHGTRRSASFPTGSVLLALLPASGFLQTFVTALSCMLSLDCTEQWMVTVDALSTVDLLLCSTKRTLDINQKVCLRFGSEGGKTPQPFFIMGLIIQHVENRIGRYVARAKT